MANTTISDVAKRAGVSTATVSNVINNKPGVTQITRDTVIEAMNELNYRPRGTARNLKRERSFPCIGVVVKELDNPYYTDVVSGIRQYAKSKGYTVFVTSSEGNFRQEKVIIDQLTNKDVNGVIIAPSLSDPDAEFSHLFQLQSLNYPFVLLEKVQGIHASVVDIDHVSSTKSAVKYLIDSGHSKIIHFSGPEYTSHTMDRIRGVREAYSESSLVFQEDKVLVSSGSRLEGGYETAMSYFRDLPTDEYPTAIVCYNDLIALGAIAALTELGIDVPGDVSVIGDDDIEFAKRFPIPLTTIHTPKIELGQKAAELLIDAIEASEQLPPQKLLLRPELIVRKSTRKLVSD
ncbi:MAG: LacI family transcriptional regulator [Candidatus Marinimicrobia bacterium]|nr:LacI family transcriptional regulator [Candidatus Neomarinimicrobiota bacterium]MCF7880235.1 LacI family transcriptional regulator [Candidatus Neomarinimicrobiota bacterium]